MKGLKRGGYKMKRKRFCPVFVSLLFIFLLPACLAEMRMNAIRDYQSRNSTVSQEVLTAIRLGDIIMGMTKEEVELSWGYATRTGRTYYIGENIYTSWIYPFIMDMNNPRYWSIVYFKNGKVIGVRR